MLTFLSRFLILFCALIWAHYCSCQAWAGELPQDGDIYTFHVGTLSVADYDQAKSGDIWDLQLKSVPLLNTVELHQNYSAELIGDLLMTVDGNELYGLSTTQDGLWTNSFKQQFAGQNLVFECQEPQIFRPKSLYVKRTKKYESSCSADIPIELVYTNQIGEVDAIRFSLQQTTLLTSLGRQTIAVNGVKDDVTILQLKKTATPKVSLLKDQSWTEMDLESAQMIWSDLIADATIIEEHYYRESDQLPFAIAQIQDTKINFRIQSANIGEKNNNATDKFIEVGPNPTFGELYFSFKSFEPGRYTIKIFNIIGKSILEEKIKVTGNSSSMLDISSLSKGTYLYSIFNEQGHNLQTKRLIKINP